MPIWCCPRDGFVMNFMEFICGGRTLIFKCNYCGCVEMIDAGKQYRHGGAQVRKWLRARLEEYNKEGKKNGRADNIWDKRGKADNHRTAKR